MQTIFILLILCTKVNEDNDFAVGLYSSRIDKHVPVVNIALLRPGTHIFDLFSPLLQHVLGVVWW